MLGLAIGRPPAVSSTQPSSVFFPLSLIHTVPRSGLRHTRDWPDHPSISLFIVEETEGTRYTQ